MEVNQVRFGNYTIGNSLQRQQKKEEKPAEESQTQSLGGKFKSVNRDDLLNAMNMVGLQNLPQITSAGTKEINPAEFLEEGRIADIEAMMAEFENGVNIIAEAIRKEFPEMSEADINTLAALIFAQG